MGPAICKFYGSSFPSRKIAGHVHQLQDTIPQHCGESKTADDLNEFYCRFEKTPHTCSEHLSTQPLTPPANPPLPHTCTSDQRRRCAPGLPEAEKEKSTRPRLCYTSLSEILCWPAGPHLHTDHQQITGAVRSPFMLQTLHHHPHPKEIQNYRTKLAFLSFWWSVSTYGWF